MPFQAVEQVMDSVAGAAYVEQELLHVFSQVHEEIVPGFDLRDAVPGVVSAEGADMDTVARDNVKAYGEPQWVAKVSNKKEEVNEVKDRETFNLHELCLSSKFRRKELRQAAKFNRPLQASRLNNAKTALNLKIRNSIYDGVAELGMAGMLSSIDNLVHDQAGGATSGISDKDLEDLFLGFATQFLEEIGSDYPISHVIMAPSWNERISRTYGVEGSRTMKEVLAAVLNVPAQNWYVDHRLKAKSVGSYSNKDMVLFLPAYPRIFEILNPVRLMQEEPYMDGSDLVIDQTVQFGGIAFYEKVGLLAQA